MVGDDFTRQKIVIRFKLSHNDFPTDEDEKEAEGLAMQLDAVLTEDGRGEINGMEYMAGWMNILIFGRETDDDTDNIYEQIRPAFLDYPYLRGSHIVRWYGEIGENMEVSDTV